jgi:group I intron endonuclease
MAEVYKITNNLTNKSYIGYTSKSSNQRLDEHLKDALKYNKNCNRKFYNAIRKYGKDAWSLEILIANIDVSLAKEKEIEMIEVFDTYNTGYNSTRGGDGNNGIIMSEESNQKRSLALKGIPKTYNRMKDKKHSDESKLKISNSHRGMKKPWVSWGKEQIVKRAMTRRSITKEQYDTMQSLLKLGKSLKEISNIINLSYDMTKKWAKKEWEL